MSVIKAIMASYGLEDPKKAVGKMGKSREFKDTAVLTKSLIVGSSEEEERFLAMHTDVLKKIGIDQVKKQGLLVFYMFKKLPTIIKVMLITAWCFFVVCMIPQFIWMAIGVLSSKIAQAKLLMMFFFVLLIFMLQKLIGI